jgi:flagellar motility protein MotE (MotC chaperone)
MLYGAKAWAEELAPTTKAQAKAAKLTAVTDGSPDAVKTLIANTASVGPQASAAAPKPPASPVCAPTPAELARQAGMSPAELQVLQSLGARRTQLDAREQSLSTQLQLLAAAEAKVDGKLKQLTGLKSDIQGLLGQADAQKTTEMAKLVTVYEGMPAADAAARMSLLDDSVRLPLASKMSIRKLSAMLAKMSPADAKSLTEKLADRMTAADKAKQAVAAATAPQPATPPAAPASGQPKKS